MILFIKFQKLEEEIARCQSQIEKMERLRKKSRTRFEYHSSKHDESIENSKSIRLDSPPCRDIDKENR